MTEIVYVYVVLDGQTNFCQVYDTNEAAEEYLLTVDNPQNYVIQKTKLLSTQ
jgi:hypothetical protein